VDSAWLVNGKVVTPDGVTGAAVLIAGGRIAKVQRHAPRGRRTIDVRGAYVAPGFIDLHVWGDPVTVSRYFAAHGTTAFLSAIGPEPSSKTGARLDALQQLKAWPGAACLGAHLEGPFLNPKRGGALPKRWMRRPTTASLNALAARGGIRMLTLAPELPGAMQAIRWCRGKGIIASLGHTDADARTAARAVAAGARAVTHVFNAMRPFHHRAPSLLEVALTDPRLTTMVILDQVHVSAVALRLLVRTKGPERIVLVTDSIRHEGWDVRQRRGAYYLKSGTLAGSGLTMMRAVRHAVEQGGVTVAEAVRMASEVPARLLRDRSRGKIAAGSRADVVVFDSKFQVRLTVVGGRIVYER